MFSFLSPPSLQPSWGQEPPYILIAISHHGSPFSWTHNRSSEGLSFLILIQKARCSLPFHLVNSIYSEDYDLLHKLACPLSETGCSDAQSCPTLCDSMDLNPPGSSVHGILQARTLEEVLGFEPPPSSTCVIHTGDQGQNNSPMLTVWAITR